MQNTIEATEVDDSWKGDLDLAGAIAEKLYEKGICVFGSKRDWRGARSAKFNLVRDLANVGFYPPLVVTQDEIDQAMDTFEDSVREALAQQGEYTSTAKVPGRNGPAGGRQPVR